MGRGPPNEMKVAEMVLSDSPNQAVVRPAHGWTPMLFIGLGIALVIMDATIVNVSLPSIIADLQLSSIDAEWVNAVYALTFAALLIVFGRIGDKIGRARMFMLGASVFAAASIYAASSGSAAHLISARALQGVGGAMISPSSLSLVNSLYLGKARNIAFAIYGSIIGGMAALGPLVGGFLTTNYSWHWAFWINVPLAAVVVIGTWRVVPESRDPGDAGSLNLPGALLSSLGIGLLIFGLIEGRNYGWVRTLGDRTVAGIRFPAGSASPVLLGLVCAAIALVALYALETARARTGRSVLLDFSLFRIPTFGLGSAAALIVSMGEFGILFSLPLFLQSVLGYTALGAGGLLATLAAGSFFSAPTAAQLANRRSPRFVARLGMGLEVVGILGLGLFLSTSVSAWMLSLWLVIYGMGVGFASAQLTGLILADVPVRQSGQASGTQSTARQIGSALGTAVLGTVLFVSLASKTESRLLEAGFPDAMASGLSHSVQASAGTIIPSLGQPPGTPELREAVAGAFASSLSLTAFVAAGFVALGLLATLALPAEDARKRADQVADARSSTAE